MTLLDEITGIQILGMQRYVIKAAEPHGLPLNQQIMPQYFSELGFKSHAVGKWHLGHHTAGHTPTHRGFLQHMGYWAGKEDYFDHSNQNQVNFYYQFCNKHCFAGWLGL